MRWGGGGRQSQGQREEEERTVERGKLGKRAAKEDPSDN